LHSYPSFLASTVFCASSANMLKAHCRQQGPSCVPVTLSVAGLWPQIEQ
jgi:ribonuclease I